jgi:hypothetical protein
MTVPNLKIPKVIVKPNQCQKLVKKNSHTNFTVSIALFFSSLKSGGYGTHTLSPSLSGTPDCD